MCSKMNGPPLMASERPKTKLKLVCFLGENLQFVSFSPRASERRVLQIVELCYTSSYVHIFTASHVHILTSSHLLVFTSSLSLLLSLSSHLHVFSSSHLHSLSSSLSFSLSLSLLALGHGLSPSFSLLSVGRVKN